MNCYKRKHNQIDAQEGIYIAVEKYVTDRH